MKEFLYYFLFFVIYCFLGWLMESIFCACIEKKWANRGFLIGPWCPIYGFGVLIGTFYITQYRDNAVTVFLLAAIICSILEYVTSYIMEKIFKTRWWDYSNHKFNLNGRICLSNSIGFGLLTLLVIYVLNPLLFSLLDMLPNLALLIIGSCLLVLFIIDTVTSFNIIYKIKKTADTLRRDSTNEISKMVEEIINKKFFQRRILKAFPKFKILKKHN